MKDETTASVAGGAEAGLDPLAACTLPPEGLEERLAWIRSEILPHAITSERGADGVAWELEGAPGLTEKLDRLVAAERECCSGIVFTHAAGATPGGRRLEVHGVDPDAAVFSAQQNERATPSLSGRVAKAAGIGTAVSLLICCVLPVALGGLLGAAVAAPFASLDQPWVIGAAFVLFAAATFGWQSRRRASTQPVPEVGAPCC
jgi:hypothetical protein